MKRILVAIDESPRAPDVVAEGLAMARRAGASMRLFQGIEIPQDFPPAAHVARVDPLPAILHDAAVKRLEAFTAGVHDVKCDLEVEPSMTPWRAILAAADAYGADLIMLGSHGYRLIDHVLGTTAARVVNEAKRNVFVVHHSSMR